MRVEEKFGEHTSGRFHTNMHTVVSMDGLVATRTRQPQQERRSEKSLKYHRTVLFGTTSKIRYGYCPLGLCRVVPKWEALLTCLNNFGEGFTATVRFERVTDVGVQCLERRHLVRESDAALCVIFEEVSCRQSVSGTCFPFPLSFGRKR